MIEIREARESDAAEILNYLNEVAGETHYLTFKAGEFDLSEAAEELVIATHRKLDNQLFLVATADDRIVGVLTFEGGSRKRNAHTGEFGITVLRDYWNRGIGGRLLQQLIDWAGASEVIRKIDLRVSTDNERAIALYRNFGFVREGIISRDLIIDGTFRDAYHMGLQID